MNNHTYAKYLITMASFSSKNFSSGKFRKSSIDLNEIQQRKKRLASRKKDIYILGSLLIEVKIMNTSKLINQELYSVFDLEDFRKVRYMQHLLICEFLFVFFGTLPNKVVFHALTPEFCIANSAFSACFNHKLRPSI